MKRYKVSFPIDKLQDGESYFSFAYKDSSGQRVEYTGIMQTNDVSSAMNNLIHINQYKEK